MLRLDQIQCATDVLGDVDPCLFGRGPAFSTPAAQAEGVLQFALDRINFFFDPGDTLLVVGKLASFFEFLSQLDQVLLIFISGLGVERLGTVFTQGGADRQLGQLLGLDPRSARIDSHRGNSRDQIQHMKFPAWFTQKKRELPKPLGISQANEASFIRQRPVLALTSETGLGNGLTLLFFSSHDVRARRVRQTWIEIRGEAGAKDLRKSAPWNWNGVKPRRMGYYPLRSDCASELRRLRRSISVPCLQDRLLFTHRRDLSSRYLQRLGWGRGIEQICRSNRKLLVYVPAYQISSRVGASANPFN